jgi:gas vesicle protein
MKEECFEVQEKSKGSFTTVLKGLLIGGLIGAGVGLLSAPRTGEDTRNMLRERGIELRDKAMETADEARLRAEELARTGTDRAVQLKDRGQSKLSEQVTYVQGAVEGLREGIRTYKQLNEENITPGSPTEPMDTGMRAGMETGAGMSEGTEPGDNSARQF